MICSPKGLMIYMLASVMKCKDGVLDDIQSLDVQALD